MSKTMQNTNHGPINIGLSPKLGEHHNIVGGVIWWVLSEIQSLDLYNTPTTPFQNELRTNLNRPIASANRYRIESKTWGTSYIAGGVIWLVLSEIQSLELYNTPTTPFQNELRTNLNRPISRTNRYRLSRKLGEHHNIVGGVIWLVLSEIQSLELYNTLTTPFQNEFPTKLNCQISWTNRYRIEAKTWGTS